MKFKQTIYLLRASLLLACLPMSTVLTAQCPTITTPPTSQPFCAGGEATFSVAATGSGSLSYQWQQTCPATEWTVYKSHSYLPHNNVASVYESDGVIYIGLQDGGYDATFSGGVATLDVGAGATTWTVYNTDNSNLPHDEVSDVYESGGVIYAATDFGVATLDVGAGATTWTVYNDRTSNFPFGNVYGVYESGGVIYAATDDGVATLDVGAGATTWTVYNTDNSNLPDDDVSGVYESGGVIYAATFGGGVATLDVGAGETTWRVYHTGNSNLPNNLVFGIYVSGGVIYAATFGGGVATLRVGAGETTWRVYRTDNSNLPNNDVYGIYESGGVIYAATFGGLATLAVGAGATIWTVYNTSNSNFPNNGVWDVYESGGVIYAATYGGVATLDVGAGATIWTVYNTSNSNLPINDVRGVYESDGVIYAATFDGGLATLDVAAGATTWTVYDTSNSSLSSNRVLDVYVSGGGIYTGLRDGGVGILPNVAMDIPNATSATYTFSPTAAAADGTYPVVVSHANGCSITSEAVSLTINNPPTITTPPIDQAVCPGDEATFSVAASGSGTLRYQWQQTCQATEWTVYNMSNSNFPRNSVQDVYESGGVIYAATFSGGVATLDVAAGATTWTVYNTGNSNLPNNNCFGVYESDGVIYAATSGGDVATLDVGAGATIWTVYNTSNSNFPYAAVLGVYESGGVIYAATSGGGVATLDVGAGAMIWTVYNTSNSNLPHDDVTGVYESGGVIYAATGGGVATLAVGAGATTWTVYDTSNSNLPSNGVSSVYESGGVIYAATYGSGLATLDVGAGAMTWMVYNTSNSNLPQNTVTGVYESDGVIYAATFGGVATLDVGASAMIWTVYNKSNSNLPNNNISSVYESDGVIYAATEGGGVATLDLGGMDIPNATSATYTFSLTAAAADCTYQVVVSDASGCRVTSEAVSLTIEESCIVPVEVVLEDPCSCLNNASTIDLDAGAGGADGQFAELVTLRGVGGATLASNLDYRVVSMVGGADADNIPAVGTQSDGTAIAPGTAFTFNATTSFYELAFVHVDEVGYTLIVQQYIDDVAAGDQYMIANNCAYPNPTFDPVLVDLYCPDAPAFLLGAMPAGADGVTYTIDGNAATQVDPPNLSIGFHTVLMTYDAAAGANGGISPDGGTTPALPGCVQTVQKVIEVNDTEPPMITCPVDVTIECDEDSSPANTGTATATDNCNTAPVITFTDMVAPGTCPQESTITRTWTATDGVNLMATCVQTITIVDTQAPTIACPADLTLQCVSGQDTSPATTGTASATDACDPNPVITFADNVIPGNCAGNYVIERTWTATDECGTAATCLQVIRVEDTTPPVIACPADLTLQCVSGQDTSPATTGTASATDACDPNPVITFADNVVPGNCAGNYVIERTWTATDECGNPSTCVQTITIQDTQAPTVTCTDFTDTFEGCPDAIGLNTPDGVWTAVGADGGFTAAAGGTYTITGDLTACVSDNCAALADLEYTLFSSREENRTACAVTVVNEFSIRDACGNVAAEQVVTRHTIEDTTPPMITCPADVTTECDEDDSPANTGMATTPSTCNPTPTISYMDVLSPLADGYLITRSWTATDACGNSSSCEQLITVASCEPQLMDPCSCINNATIFDLDTGLGGDDGQFSELVAVTGPNGAPILANSLITWQVFSSSGGVDAFAATPLAPAQTAGNPIPVGTELFYNPATGHYELPFYHYDGVGYSLSVQQFVNGMPGQILGPISNNCVYPNPVFDPVFQDLYCPDEPAFTLGGVDNNGLGFDVVSFTIDGNAATQLDPSALSVGFHTVLMTWDGAAGTNNGSGTMANPNEPGCEQSVQKGNYSGCLKGYFAKKSYFLG
jgi:hypothetical protein